MDLPEEIMCKEKIVALWRKKNRHNGFQYRRHKSTRQAWRVRYLYQCMHQCPIGRIDDITLKFAVALLAERDSHKTNWCALAEQYWKRRGRNFESTGEYRQNLEREGKKWPANEVGPETGSETGREEDWLVNMGGKTGVPDGSRIQCPRHPPFL
jgi:hypothetical protein